MNPAWSIGSISVATPPSGLIMTIEDVRAHLHIDGTDDDPVIERMLRAATSRFDGPHGTGWALRQQRWKWILSDWPCYEHLPDSPQSWIRNYYDDAETIALPGHPVTNLVSVEYLTDPTTWSAISDVTLLASEAPEQPSLIYKEGGFPDLVEHRPYGIRILFDVGTDAVPEEIELGILMTVGQWYQAREGLMESMMQIPAGAQRIMSRYRNMVGRFG